MGGRGGWGVGGMLLHDKSQMLLKETTKKHGSPKPPQTLKPPKPDILKPSPKPPSSEPLNGEP